MRRGTIVLIVFILVVVGVIGFSQFLRNQPPLKVKIMVDALAADWVSEAAARLNATKPLANNTRPVEFEVSVISEMDVWRGNVDWTSEDHPDGWIPSSALSIDYAQNANVPVETVTPSVARTVLVWGGYASRVAVMTEGDTLPLDWGTVSTIAEAEAWENLGGETSWRFFKLGFSLPDRTMSGLGVLFTGAAHFNESPDLTGGATRGTALYQWLQPIIDSVPNFQTLGGDAAQAMTRGPSTVEIALLPESQWLDNLSAMTANEAIELQYPAYQFVLDFPLARWNGPQTTDEQRAAVTLFGNWLISEAEQSQAIAKGLRPAHGEPPATAALFKNAAVYGIQLAPNYGQIVEPPERNEAQGLVQWFITNQRR